MIASIIGVVVGMTTHLGGSAADVGFASAEASWGPAPCAITLVHADLPGRLGGVADPATCTVTLDVGKTWRVRCALAKHEAGHIRGLPHNPDEHSVMHFPLTWIPRDCRR